MVDEKEKKKVITNHKPLFAAPLFAALHSLSASVALI